jgi:serine/threonine protein kinase
MVYDALKMPLYVSGTLSSRVKPCSCSFLVRVGTSIRATLQRAHSSLQVHLDVKPDNIFLCPDGEPLLGDYGVSCRVGTPPRGISPQYYPGDLPVVAHPAVDLLLLAVTLMEMVGVVLPAAKEYKFEHLTSALQRYCLPFIRC